jgi:hypothetical protein
MIDGDGVELYGTRIEEARGVETEDEQFPYSLSDPGCAPNSKSILS